MGTPYFFQIQDRNIWATLCKIFPTIIENYTRAIAMRKRFVQRKWNQQLHIIKNSTEYLNIILFELWNYVLFFNQLNWRHFMLQKMRPLKWWKNPPLLTSCHKILWNTSLTNSCCNYWKILCLTYDDRNETYNWY